MRKKLTLCLIHKPLDEVQGKLPRILLGMKKRGFGAGRWNGFGGKVEEGETIEAAAMREFREEAGLVPKDLTKAGVLDFEFQNDPKILEVHIFRASEFEGEPKESEEMLPKWFNVADIPFAQMWPDDSHWMPLFLAGKKFTGRFLFDKPSDAEYMSKIIEKDISEVNEI